MFKQILGKLPKKPCTKLSDNDDEPGGLSSSHLRTRTCPGNDDEPSSGNGPSDGHDRGSGCNQGDKLPSSLNGDSGCYAYYKALPRLRDVPVSEKQDLVLVKLKICSVVLDFADPSGNLKEKEFKRQTLLELVDYVISAANGKFSDSIIQEAVKMISVNLFEFSAYQPGKNKALQVFDLEEDDASLNPAWPHLQIVYEFLLRLVASSNTDPKLSKRYIDHTFVLRLLDLFDSEDPREREYLKTILHRIYGRFMVHRPFIRKTMNNIFYRFIFETGKHYGIAEFLEVLGSIINGFALPLKEEHKLFLARLLLPLHKLKCLPSYHQQLSYCIMQFVEKDVKLADTVIRGLLKYWPVTNSSKEVMFLNELEEVLEATQPAEFERCMVPLFRQVSHCLSSSHFQVAERALYLWNNDRVRDLVRHNCRVVLPIVLPALEKTGSSHWNQAVKRLTQDVLKVLSDTDRELFEECLGKLREEEAKAEVTKRKQGEAWRQLEEIAAKRHIINM